MTIPYAYRRAGSLKPKAVRANPEAIAQKSVKEFLVFCLPPEVKWSATLNGVRLTPQTLAKAKASGLRKGPLDIVLVWSGWRGHSKWIEMKSDVGRLTVEQKEWIAAVGLEHCAVCRTVDDVAAALTGWGVTLRAMPR